MTSLTSQALAQAADIVMQDLVDCLLAEHFFGNEPSFLVSLGDWQQAHPQAPALAGRVWDWCYDPAEQRFISIACVRASPSSGKRCRALRCWRARSSSGRCLRRKTS